MKTFTVSAQELQDNDGVLSAEHYLKVHKESEKAYWRRLVRLYRCHHLPHDICRYLNINEKQFVNDIKALHEDGKCLGYDTRQDADFESTVAPSRLSKADLQRLKDDEQFYASIGLLAAERSKLLMQTYSRHRNLKKSDDVKEPVDIKKRNEAIVALFIAEENKQGLKRKLANSYGLSRKSIDLILSEHGVNHIVTSTHKDKPNRQSKKQGIVNYYKEFKADGKPEEKIVIEIAKTMECSVSYVYQVLKETISG